MKVPSPYGMRSTASQEGEDFKQQLQAEKQRLMYIGKESELEMLFGHQYL